MYFDIFKNPNARGHKYWWVAKGDNHEPMAASEMLASKQSCLSSIRTIMREAASANIYDETGETRGSVQQRKLT